MRTKIRKIEIPIDKEKQTVNRTAKLDTRNTGRITATEKLCKLDTCNIRDINEEICTNVDILVVTETIKKIKSSSNWIVDVYE